MMETSKGRILSGVAANLYSQAVTIVMQLATLPIFLSRWSSEEYGRWLIISAIPAYLGISDVGILTAAGNLMAMHQARGETPMVNRIFNSGLAALLLILPPLALCASVLLTVYSFGMDIDERKALFVMILTGLLNVSSTLFDAVYRSFGMYPRVAFLLTTVRVFDFFGVFAGLLIGGTLTSTAVGFLTIRSISTVVMFGLTRKDVPQVRWNLREMDFSLMRRLMRNGVGFLSFPLGYMLTLQGLVLLVGAQLGGTAVALFSSSRTLARLLAQISDAAGKSVAPEISALYGAGREAELNQLVNRVLWRVVLLIVLCACALAPLGPTILRIWSHGKIGFDYTVFTFLLAGAVAAAYWQVQSVRLTATNRHEFVAATFSMSSACAVVLAYFTIGRYGVAAAAAAACSVDLAMVIGTSVAVRRLPAAHGGMRLA